MLRSHNPARDRSLGPQNQHDIPLVGEAREAILALPGDRRTPAQRTGPSWHYVSGENPPRSASRTEKRRKGVRHLAVSAQRGERAGPVVRNLVWVRALLLTCYVTLGMLLALLEPRFSHAENC